MVGFWKSNDENEIVERTHSSIDKESLARKVLMGLGAVSLIGLGAAGVFYGVKQKEEALNTEKVELLTALGRIEVQLELAEEKTFLSTSVNDKVTKRLITEIEEFLNFILNSSDLKEIKLNSFQIEVGEVGVFTKSFPEKQGFSGPQNLKIKKRFLGIKIIWIKLNGKGIFNLQKEIDDKLKDLFEKEERFMSHLTIARVKHVSSKKDLLNYLKSIKPKKLKFFCDRFYLKKSELKANGPEYGDLESYKLSEN